MPQIEHPELWFDSLPKEAGARREAMQALTVEERNELTAYYDRRQELGRRSLEELFAERDRLAKTEPDGDRLGRADAALREVATRYYLDVNRGATLRELGRQLPPTQPTGKQQAAGLTRRLEELSAQPQPQDEPARQRREAYERWLRENQRLIKQGVSRTGAPDAAPKMSPQLRAAILQASEKQQHTLLGALEELGRRNVAQGLHSDPGEPGITGTFDSRSIGILMAQPREGDARQRGLIGAVLVKELALHDRESRYETLREFYDRTDVFDPTRLDLSCLSGQDCGERGIDGLTPSERDVRELVSHFGAAQSVVDYMAYEKDGYYFRERYTTPAEQARAIAKADLMIALSPILLNYASANGLSTDFETERAGIPPVDEYAALTNAGFDVHIQKYQMALAGIEGRAPNPVLLRLDGVMRRGEGADAPCAVDCLLNPGIPSQKGMRFAEAALNSAVFQPLFTTHKASLSYMRDHGLQPMDLLYLDGRPVRTVMTERYPDTMFTGAAARFTAGERDEYRERLIMADILKAMAKGPERVEAAIPVPGRDGKQALSVTELRADTAPLRQQIKKSEYSTLRLLFDWGPFKVKTSTDQAMERWNSEDPEKDARRQEILRDAGGKAERGAQKAAELARRKEEERLARERKHQEEQREEQREKQTVQDITAVSGKLGEDFTGAERDAILTLGEAAGLMRRGVSREVEAGSAVVVSLCDLLEEQPQLKAALIQHLPKGEESLQQLRKMGELYAGAAFNKLPPPERREEAIRRAAALDPQKRPALTAALGKLGRELPTPVKEEPKRETQHREQQTPRKL